MRAVAVSSAFSLIRLNLTKNIHEWNGRPLADSLLSIAESQYGVSKRQNFGTRERNPSFRWISTVGEKAQSTVLVPTSVPVRVAHELLQAGHRYLDVRTIEEFSAGRPVGAVNVPYMFRIGSGMTKNVSFLEEVLEHFQKHDEILVGCRSGRRSLLAATDLMSAGFSGVTDVAGGYIAWVENRLPSE